MGEVYSGEGMYRRERSTFWVEKRNNKEVEKVNHNRRLRNSLNNRNGNHNSLGTRKSHRPDEKKKRVEFKKGGRSECGKCENFSAVWGVSNSALQLSESWLPIVRLLVIFLIRPTTVCTLSIYCYYVCSVYPKSTILSSHVDARDFLLKKYCHLRCPQPQYIFDLLLSSFRTFSIAAHSIALA